MIFVNTFSPYANTLEHNFSLINVECGILKQDAQDRTVGEKLKKKLGVDYNAFRVKIVTKQN